MWICTRTFQLIRWRPHAQVFTDRLLFRIRTKNNGLRDLAPSSECRMVASNRDLFLESLSSLLSHATLHFVFLTSCSISIYHPVVYARVFCDRGSCSVASSDGTWRSPREEQKQKIGYVSWRKEEFPRHAIFFISGSRYFCLLNKLQY